MNRETPPSDDSESADEAQLIQRARKRDAEALHQLVDRYAHDLYVTAMYLTGRHEDARDTVQETLAAMVRNLPAFRGDSSLKTWLWGILFRQAMRVRRNRRQPDLHRMEFASYQRSESSSTDVRIDLYAALAKLSEEHRQVLVLRELEGMSYGQMAEVLMLPQGTIESRLHRARQALRKSLTAYEREVQNDDQ